MNQPASDDFFIAGGTLRANASSYISRPADDELYTHIKAGEFCYVLTPRQMGKSSLMVSTALRLQRDGFATAKIDLTKIGTTDIGRWYLGILTQIEKELKLGTNPGQWWKDNQQLSPVQVFIYFLREVLLTKTTSNIVIFIDEIDSTLKYDFRDDFFAGIRSMYNSRAEDPEFNRLTFVLLGVAAPTDLIKDRTRTPFNIGQEISLTNFSREEVSSFESGFEKTFPGQSAILLDRIYYWSNGHPYLTQKLCMALAEQSKMLDEQEIDNFVRQAFLSQEAYRETNLQFVRDMLVKNAQKRQLVSLYAKIRKGGKVPEDKKSPLQNQLRLSGLINSQDGYLMVNNRIYQEAFNPEWIKENTEINWPPIIATMTTIIALFFVGISTYNGFILPFQIAQAEICFYSPTEDAEDKLSCLATMFRKDPLFGVGDNDDKASLNYFSLSSWEDQKSIFEAQNVESRDLIEVIRGLYHALADLNQTGENTRLLIIMKDAVAKVNKTPETTRLEQELDAWLMARNSLKQDDAEAALTSYNEAIDINPENPSTVFERGMLLLRMGESEDALQSFDETLRISKKSAPADQEAETPTTIPETVEVLPSVLPTLPIGSQTTLPPTPISTPGDPVPQVPLSAQSPITSEFHTHTKRAVAIRKVLDDNPNLFLVLQNSSADQYTNLRSTPQIASLLASAILRLTITANSQTYSQLDQSITLVYILTNTGANLLGPAQFTISDNKLGTPFNCGPPQIVLQTNQTLTCSAGYTITQADMSLANLTISATASGGGLTSAPATITITNFTIPESGFTPGSTIQHQVTEGEWLDQIARCYGANLSAVRAANPQINDARTNLAPGTVIVVPNIGSTGNIFGPPCVLLYTVQSGDTWNSIAQRFNADVGLLQAANPVSLTAGIVLKIPLSSAGAGGTTIPPTSVTAATPIGPFPFTIEAGQTTGTRIGVVNPNEIIQYVLNATQGQNLMVKLTSTPNEVGMGVTGPTGLLLKPVDTTVTWLTTIPTSGDYLITIANLTGGSSKSYVLEVTLASPSPVPVVGPGLTQRPEPPFDATNTPVAFSTLPPSSTPSRPRACSDGIDNDGDGLTDFPADPQCQTRADDSESE